MLMKFGGFHFGRRNFLLTSLGAYFFMHQSLGRAETPTDITILNSVAIPVKNPSEIILIAVTKAGDRLVAVGEHGAIIFSDSQGVTWTQASVPVDVTLTCVSFATPMVGWAAGHFGVILKTIDGGKTWFIQLNGIQVNQLTLAAAQDPSVQTSNSPAAPLAMKRAEFFMQAGPSKPFLSILALSPQRVLVFGAYRMTMITTDGGKTWSDWSLHIGDKFSHNLYAATVSGSEIYIVGEAGLIFRSTDNGNNFPQETSPSGVTLFGVVAAHDGSITVFGVAGVCFRTTDGGNSWVPLNLGTQDNLTAGCILPSGVILIASASGLVFASHNNGLTFSPVSGMPPMTISDVTYAPDGTLIFVGYSGVSRAPVSLINH